MSQQLDRASRDAAARQLGSAGRGVGGAGGRGRPRRLDQQWLRRGSHRSVPQLTRSIQSWIEAWNQDPRPFVWTRTADEILDTIAAYCQRINDSEH